MKWLSMLSVGARIAGIGGKIVGIGGHLAGLSIVNPWVILTALLATLGSCAGGAKVAHTYATNQCKATEVDRMTLLNEIRSVNLELANGIAFRTEEAIGKIRINHRTVIQPEIRHEREIHKVLQDPACSVPGSTVNRVLNPARGYIDRGPPAGQPDGPVRPSQAAPDGEAAPPG